MSILSQTGAEFVRRHEMPITHFQVLGERCSGTNIVRWLISNNLRLRHESFMGWKHGFPSALGISPASLVVCVFRNPVDWLTSVFTKPFHLTPHMRSLSFPEFIRHEWASHIDRPKHLGVKALEGIKYQVLQHDRHPLTGAPFANACQLRAAKAQALLSFRRRDTNYVFVTLETFLSDKQGHLQQLAETFELTLAETFVDSGESMGSGSFAKAERPAPTRDDLTFLLSELDDETESDLGYLEGLQKAVRDPEGVFDSRKIFPPRPLRQPSHRVIPQSLARGGAAR